MLEPVLLRDRSTAMQILLAGVVPAAIGALAGVLIGISEPAYWAVALIAAVGGFLAGFEHRDGWEEPIGVWSAASSTDSRC